MILLSSSSFFLPAYLSNKLTDNEFSTAQFNFALQRNYIAALIIAEKNTHLGSANWLKLNKVLAKNDSGAALKLALWFQGELHEKTPHESTKLTTSQAIMWFEQAIRLSSQSATVGLAQFYYLQNEPIKAVAILNKIPEELADHDLAQAVLLLRVQMAIDFGDVALVEQILNVNTSILYDSVTLAALFADIDKYAVLKNRMDKTAMLSNTVFASGEKKAKIPLQTRPTCFTSLQLFATNLKHLNHLEQLIKAFNEQQQLSQYICLPVPLYISKKQLKCVSKSTQAITCDESLWLSIAEEVNTRHIGLMLEKGGANVHFGILYFDAEDDANVFSHEVSHLLGFVDEYPLKPNHATCQHIQTKTFSHNIAVLKRFYEGDKKKLRADILMNIPWANSIKASTPILAPVGEKSNTQKRWRLGTPEVYKEQIGVYLSESCQQSVSQNNLTISNSSTNNVDLTYTDFLAFKPLNRSTQLRYYGNDFPKEYLAMLSVKPSAYTMPSFHYNIALALYLQGEVSNAKYWLRQASRWEKDPLRKLAVLKGEF